jgi:hypothetical protein
MSINQNTVQPNITILYGDKRLQRIFSYTWMCDNIRNCRVPDLAKMKNYPLWQVMVFGTNLWRCVNDKTLTICKPYARIASNGKFVLLSSHLTQTKRGVGGWFRYLSHCYTHGSRYLTQFQWTFIDNFWMKTN